MGTQCVWHRGGQETDQPHQRPEGTVTIQEACGLWRPALLNKPWRSGADQTQGISSCAKGREKGNQPSAMMVGPVSPKPVAAKHTSAANIPVGSKP